MRHEKTHSWEEEYQYQKSSRRQAEQTSQHDERFDFYFLPLRCARLILTGGEGEAV